MPRGRAISGRRPRLCSGVVAALVLGAALTACSDGHVVASEPQQLYLKVPSSWTVFSEHEPVKGRRLQLPVHQYTDFCRHRFRDQARPPGGRLQSDQLPVGHRGGPPSQQCRAVADVVERSAGRSVQRRYPANRRGQCPIAGHAFAPGQRLLHGTLVAYEIQGSQANSALAYEQETWVNSATSKVWVLMAGCSPSCFQAQQPVISRIMQSFLVTDRGSNDSKPSDSQGLPTPAEPEQARPGPPAAKARARKIAMTPRPEGSALVTAPRSGRPRRPGANPCKRVPSRPGLGAVRVAPVHRHRPGRRGQTGAGPWAALPAAVGRRRGRGPGGGRAGRHCRYGRHGRRWRHGRRLAARPALAVRPARAGARLPPVLALAMGGRPGPGQALPTGAQRWPRTADVGRRRQRGHGLGHVIYGSRRRVAVPPWVPVAPSAALPGWGAAGCRPRVPGPPARVATVVRPGAVGPAGAGTAAATGQGRLLEATTCPPARPSPP